MWSISLLHKQSLQGISNKGFFPSFFSFMKLSQKWKARGLIGILDSIYHNRKVIAGSIILHHHTILFKQKSVTLSKHESSSKVEGWLFLTQFTKGHKHANELKTYSSFLKRMDWGI